MPRTDTPADEQLPVEQPPADALPATPAEVASSDSTPGGEAVKAVTLVLLTPNVAVFRWHTTATVDVPDPDKDDGSLKSIEVEVPIDITPEGTDVSPDVVDSIRAAALDAGLVVTEKG